MDKNQELHGTPEEETTQESTPEQSASSSNAAEQQEASLKMQLLRVSADFSNYKRRTEKDRTLWITSAQKSVLISLLPVLDDLERALTSTKDLASETATEKVLEGFELIYKNFKKSLDDLGVKEIDCSQQFNPEYHEAVMQVTTSEHESNAIVAVISKGYTFKDTVLRHAKVSVAS